MRTPIFIVTVCTYLLGSLILIILIDFLKNNLNIIEIA